MLIIINHEGGIRISPSGLRVIGSGNIIGIKRQRRISLCVNRNRLAGLLKRQPSFIRIPDLNGDIGLQYWRHSAPAGRYCSHQLYPKT